MRDPNKSTMQILRIAETGSLYHSFNCKRSNRAHSSAFADGKKRIQFHILISIGRKMRSCNRQVRPAHCAVFIFWRFYYLLPLRQARHFRNTPQRLCPPYAVGWSWPCHPPYMRIKRMICWGQHIFVSRIGGGLTGNPRLYASATLSRYVNLLNRRRRQLKNNQRCDFT